MYTEEKIASFTQKGIRIQLLKMTYAPANYGFIKYQVRINRKVEDTSISEYQMRKLFAQIVQNTVLQLKIY